MNFLAHLFLADITRDSLIGQLLGDFVKGSALGKYSGDIQSAILFHRKIDSYCDAHPLTRVSRNRVGPRRRRFAGVIVDVAYDHFLAQNWHCFHPEPLSAFARRVYAVLRQDPTPLPARLDSVLPKMIAHDWLAGYLDLNNIAMALDRIAGRLSRGAPFLGSIVDIREHYVGMQNDFLSFFPDLIRFSKAYSRQSAAAPSHSS
ncbi:MAG: hypothetical protein VR64_16280 [Desulfatitalea sp. BRH_c12]|nr:MAG: hypothetical protein VR64_16280 [Desulfatitalea sp. BRH_c12]